MPPHKVDVLNREPLYDGFFKFERYKLRHETFAGGMTGTFTRELLDTGHAAAVLPYDPVRDRVVLQEQFRIGAHAAGREPWLIEIAAGLLEPGETPDELARREIVEETGLEALDLVKIGTVLVSPGTSSETVTVFCARVEAGTSEGVHGLDDENEDIRTFAVDAGEIRALLESGRVENAVAVIALQWFVLNHAEIRAKWSR